MEFYDFNTTLSASIFLRKKVREILYDIAQTTMELLYDEPTSSIEINEERRFFSSIFSIKGKYLPAYVVEGMNEFLNGIAMVLEK